MSDNLIADDHRLALASDIVAAYVSNNSVPVGDLPGLIESVYASLDRVTNPPVAAESEKPTPPVPIRKTVTPDHIVSLEDGKKYKTLRRHLSTRGMTFEEYKRKWGLPADYPSVAPSYAAQRSDLAKAAGLGQTNRKRAS